MQRRADHFGRWIHIDPDIRKSLYPVNSAIAHGGKTMIWFIGGAVNPQTGELNENHEHLQVHRELRNMYRQIAELGKPLSVYSTETTRTMDDQPKDRDVPRPLPGFPEKHWARWKAARPWSASSSPTTVATGSTWPTTTPSPRRR